MKRYEREMALREPAAIESIIRKAYQIKQNGCVAAQKMRIMKAREKC